LIEFTFAKYVLQVLGNRIGLTTKELRHLLGACPYCITLGVQRQIFNRAEFADAIARNCFQVEAVLSVVNERC